VNTTATSPKTRFVSWPSTILLALIYMITGIGNVIPFGHIAADMSKLGYPAYFLPFLGVCKLVAAGALVLPIAANLKQFAYVGMIIDLTGAIYSRLACHDTVLTIAIPILVLLLVAVSWSSLPGRKTSGS
jgi:DoxX-like family